MHSNLLEAEARAKRGNQTLQTQAGIFAMMVPVVLAGVTSLLTAMEVPALPAFAISVLGLLVVLTVFLKYLYLSRQPEGLPIRPDKFLTEPHPGMDVQGFNEMRRELMLLAFEPLGGCRVLDESGALDHRILDVWAHPVHQCYAVVDQVLPHNHHRRPIRLTYWTGMGDRWWVGTSGTATSRVSFLVRSARTVWSNHPDAGVETLLRMHLERRMDAFESTGRTAELPLSLDSYLNGEAVRYSASRETLKRKNALVILFEAVFFESLPHEEWAGDLSRLFS